jgi:HEAT repeat protein
VRLTAVRSLWPSEQSTLVPQLFDLLDHDDNPEVRAQAAAALGRFVYLGEVGKIPEATLKQIEDKLMNALDSDKNELVERRALESLGYSSRPEVPNLIEDAYESDDDEWIASALFAMGRSADDRWAPLVIERLDDTAVELSREAARAAGELELGEALPALVHLLQDEDSELRLAAAWSLSQIGGNGVADALEELLERTEDEDDIDLIENAIENLAYTQEMSGLNLLDFSPEDLNDMAHPNGDSHEDDPAGE